MPIPVDVQIPYADEAQIVVDGQANEAMWQSAPVFDEFHAYYPAPDAPVLGETRVRVLTDAKAIYFFFEVTDPEPDKVRAHLSRRDKIWRDDTLGVYLDPSADAQRGYLFMTNPYGVQADAVRVANQRDMFSWDGRWKSDGQLTETGYQVEFAIPWDTVRHPANAEQLGLSFLRATSRTSQRSGYPRRDPNIQGILIQEALVGGPGVLPKSRSLRLMPELTAGYTEEGPLEGRWGVGGVSPGLTFRYDPNPAFATLGTVNPDFSQVESDASQVDINQRYALYLRDKRPFFTEGSEWFQTEFRNLLYTRSMVQPRAGVRLTMEHQGWSVAMLSVVDSAPGATVSEGGGWSDEDLQERLASASIIRARRAIGDGGAVGAFYSDRTILGNGLSSRLGGGDINVRLSDTWIMGAAAMGSRTLLSDGSAIAGPAGTLAFSHRSLNWNADLGSTYISPGFRAENGYVTFSDRLGFDGSFGRNFYPTMSAISRVQLQAVGGEFGLTSAGGWRDHRVGPETEIEFGNGVDTEIWAAHWSELYEGQILTGVDYGKETQGNLTDIFGFGLGYEGGEAAYYDEDNPAVGHRHQVSGSLRFTPGKRWNLLQKMTWEQLQLTQELAYRGYVFRSTAEMYLNRTFWTRLILDRNSFSEQTLAELLLAWEENPGQVAYIGGSISSVGAISELAQPAEWQAFAKIAWTFGI